MKLTPLDLRKQQFGKAFRGYDADEVRSFLDLVARQWEEVQDEVRLAGERVTAMEHKLKHYERVEMALQEALEAARESARRAEAVAEQRAKMIVEEAELKAMRVVSDAEQERYHLRQDFVKLTHRQNEVAARLRGFLMSELEILAQFQGDDPVGFIRLVPAGRAGELGAGPQRAIGEGEPAAAAERPKEPTAEEHEAPAAPVESAPAAHTIGEVALPEPVAAATPNDPPDQRARPSSFESVLDAPVAAAELAPEAAPTPDVQPDPEPLPAPPAAAVQPAPSENGVPVEPAAPASQEDRPLHQILLDRLRGGTPNPGPSVWERYTAVPDEPGGDAAPASSGDAGPAPTSDAAHGWSLRSLVTGEAEPDAPAQVPADEREKIRRLLEDLD
jgi:cell division initiation protein